MRNILNTIIFDWSGTISDDRYPVYEANKRVLRNYKIELNPFEEWIKTTNGSIVSYVKSLGIEACPEEILSSYKVSYNQVVNEGLAPKSYEDAVSIISSLKKNNKILAVVSSHPQFNLEKEAKTYGLENFFEIIKGDSLDKPLHLTQIIEATQAVPQRTIYIGDMVQDIEAATKAKINCAVVATGYHSRERLEKANPSLGVFESLTELSQILI